ncbi:hypothetical protein [Desulfonatronovibrio magnus]|nr:hypothetical protein [Desulfonatronovibrio magnus]
MFIVLELFDLSFPCIVIDEDGIPIIFETREGAEQAAQELHDPRILEV